MILETLFAALTASKFHSHLYSNVYWTSWHDLSRDVKGRVVTVDSPPSLLSFPGFLFMAAYGTGSSSWICNVRNCLWDLLISWCHTQCPTSPVDLTPKPVPNLCMCSPSPSRLQSSHYYLSHNGPGWPPSVFLACVLALSTIPLPAE